MLTVKLLQTPSVLLDGEPVVFPFKRADALLYYMLIHRSATRQELIGLLWESCDETVGLKNLRNAIYTLKKTLGGDILISPQKSLVMVNQEWEIDCDYDRFVRQGDFSAYQGPFLQGFSVKNAFSYEEWLGRTREKLQERYLSSLAQQAVAAQSAGQADRAQQYAAEYLREDPFDEKMACFLMRQYRQTKQYAKAAQVYQRLKENLTTELGAAPLESTTMLYYELMNEWNDTASPEGFDGRDPVPVGREKAYAALRAAAVSFRDQAARHCSQLLSGEVGSGKSELINHFLRSVELGDFLVLRENCMLSEQERLLSLWDRMMSTVVRYVQQEGIVVAGHIQRRLGRYFPAFSQEGEPAALRQADPTLIEAAVLLVSALARRKKLLIILEDVQWCDGESLILLDALLRGAENGAVMMILTRRDNCAPAISARLERCVADGLLHEQRLYPLTGEETREFLLRELDSQAADQLAQKFYQETGGNLHLLTELTQAYRRSGDVEEVIASMQDILLNRLAGLGEDALRMAGLISLFPRAAPCSVLLSLVGQDDKQLTAGIEELSRRGLIFEESRSGAPCYCFTHQRIRELVYSRQSFFQRQPLHLRIAQLLAEGGTALGESGVHRAIAWHYRMGEAALPALDHELQALELETARHCEPFPVLSSAPEAAESAEGLNILTEKAQSDLAALRRGKADPAVLNRLERRLTLIRGRLALFQGRMAEGSAILGLLSADADPERDSGLLLQACYLLASYALSIQAADLAERYIATGMRLVERRGDPARLAMFERLRGNCFCLRGEYDKSIYYLLEAIDALGKLPNAASYRLQMAGAYYDYGRVCRQRQDYAEACSYYKKALSLLGDEDRCPGAVWIYVHYGRAAYALEDHPRAQAMFRQGYEIGEKNVELYGLAAAAAYTAYYEMQNERYDRAAQALSRAQEVSGQLDSALEKGILCFVSMKMRSALDLERHTDPALDRLLKEPAEGYARQGVRLLAELPDVFEMGLMSQCLKNGIAHKRNYRARELYSTNRNFMAE